MCVYLSGRFLGVRTRPTTVKALPAAQPSLCIIHAHGEEGKVWKRMLMTSIFQVRLFVYAGPNLLANPKYLVLQEGSHILRVSVWSCMFLMGGGGCYNSNTEYAERNCAGFIRSLISILCKTFFPFRVSSVTFGEVHLTDVDPWVFSALVKKIDYFACC